MSYVGTLQYQGFSTDQGLGFNRGTELWYVRATDEATDPKLTGLNCQQVLGGVLQRQIGQPHPEQALLPGAIVQAIGVRSLTGPWSGFVSVIYSSDVRWGGGRVLESAAESGTIELNLPVYREIPNSPGKFAEVEKIQPYQRFTNTLHRTFYASAWGPAQERVVFFNTGRLYLIGFLEYVLAGYYASRLPTNQVVVRYRFVCYAPVPAITIPADYNWVAALPALGMNEQYEVYIDGTMPKVRAKSVNDLYGDEYGEALPGID